MTRGSGDPTEDEAHALLADLEGTDEAAAAVALVRARRVQAAEYPMISADEAIAKANTYLRASGHRLIADTDPTPNPSQKLWIVGYRDPEDPDALLVGGGLVVPSNGEVYDIDSSPGLRPEFIGLEVPEDREDCPLPDDWADQLEGEYAKPYWDRLMTFVGQQRRQHLVYPLPSQTFAAFRHTKYDDVRVVILGQDPYHGAGQAHGLAFSVPAGVRTPPSLANIHKVFASDLKIDPPSHGNLEGWARQGVLLLNTTLTVRAGQPGSHRGRGWARFTSEVIRAVNRKSERVVFILWGRDAQRKCKLIDSSRHTVIRGPHPTSRSEHLAEFLASTPFTEANAALGEDRRIAWADAGPSPRRRYD